MKLIKTRIANNKIPRLIIIILTVNNSRLLNSSCPAGGTRPWGKTPRSRGELIKVFISKFGMSVNDLLLPNDKFVRFYKMLDNLIVKYNTIPISNSVNTPQIKI